MGALVLGLVGVVLLLKPTMNADQLVGGLIGLGSGIMAGMAYFSVRELGARGEPEMRTSVGAGAWLLFSDIHAVDLRSGLLLLGVACFATVAQLAMTRAYTRGKTLMSAALAYSTVIFSSLFGMAFWGEVLDASAWAAIALIILSGIAATHFSRASPVERSKTMIVIDHQPSRVNVAVFGEFTLADYKEFEEVVNFKVKFEGPVDLCFDLSQMAGLTLDVAWEEVKFSRAHANDFKRVAVVTDSQWVTWSAWISQTFVNADVEVFDNVDEAGAWLG